MSHSIEIYVNLTLTADSDCPKTCHPPKQGLGLQGQGQFFDMNLFVSNQLSYSVCLKLSILKLSIIFTLSQTKCHIYFVSNQQKYSRCLIPTVIFILFHTKYQIHIVSDQLQLNPQNERSMIFYLLWVDLCLFQVCFSRVSLYSFQKYDTD